MRNASLEIVAVLLALTVSLACPMARAAPADDAGLRTLAVQNRLHTSRHEFVLWGGVLPLDAFTKGVTLSAGYTLHFNDLIAWEIGQFTYSKGVDTHLQEDLAGLPQPVAPTPFEVVQYFATSSVVFKPLYGKLALLNRFLIHEELFAVLGAGYGRMTLTNRTVLNAGLGVRVFTGSALSVRLEVRDYVFLGAGDLHNELWISAGLSLSTGRESGSWAETY